MAEFVSAKEAVSKIRDHDTVALGGFGAYGAPDVLMRALADRYKEEFHPREITTVSGISTGDFSTEDIGMNCLAVEGLVGTIIAAHLGNPPRFGALAAENKVAAYTLPLGVVADLFRAAASGKKGVLTSIGLGTCADPRVEGCRVNQKALEQGREVVKLVTVDGCEQLYYPAFPIHACLIRGSLADRNGSVSIEKEALTAADAQIAMAVHNSGGIVIVQVPAVSEELLMPRKVRIHSSLVDYVVVVPEELQPQGYAAFYRPELSGEKRSDVQALTPMPLSLRKAIARRAAMELKPGCVINLGIGIPSGVGAVANEEGIESLLTLESGPVGGVPVEGLGFAAAVNPQAFMEMCDALNLYDGGYLDMAFLGAAQIDRHGNVNVSRFGNRCTGPGGFIDITQNTKKVFFIGTFTAGRSDIRITGGKLEILQDGEKEKFVDQVQQITFSAEYARKNGQQVTYITERAVFSLTEEGLKLEEIAPGVDLQKDILDKMGFSPVISGNLKLMEERIFREGKMELPGISIHK